MQNPIILLNDVVFRGSTLYFTLLSGILFSAVLKQKGYTSFYKNKFLYLILPYVFFTLIVACINIVTSPQESFFAGLQNYFERAFMDIVSGKADLIVWYMPVLVILCILTPLLDFLLHKNKATKIVFFFFVLAPLYFSRFPLGENVFVGYETIVYFGGAYALGMYCGIDIENTMRLIKKYAVLLIAIVALFSFGAAYLRYNDIYLVGNTILAESFYYCSKIALAGILLLFFKKLGEKQPEWLAAIAKISFPLYLIHGSILFGMAPYFIFFQEYTKLYPFNALMGIGVTAVVSFVICVSIILLCKKLFRTKSKMFIGA